MSISQYKPTAYDLHLNLTEILTEIWWLNICKELSKEFSVDLYEEWLIESAKKKWEPDFVDFDYAIQKIRENDKTFFDFGGKIYIFNISTVLTNLKKKLILEC